MHTTTHTMLFTAHRKHSENRRDRADPQTSGGVVSAAVAKVEPSHAYLTVATSMVSASSCRNRDELNKRETSLKLSSRRDLITRPIVSRAVVERLGILGRRGANCHLDLSRPFSLQSVK